MAANDLKSTLSQNGLVDFDKITDSNVRDKIVQQLESEEKTRHFFASFQFRLDEPGIKDLEDGAYKRFQRLGGSEKGWLNLEKTLRYWVRERNNPAPNGKITLRHIKDAALWEKFEHLDQDFYIPQDYVLPSQKFHNGFMRGILGTQKTLHCFKR